MTGPEHFKQAEKELDRAYVEPIDDGTASYHFARAQVHATLALTAATALAADEALPDTWYEVLD